MKPLKVSHPAVTSKALLRMADSIPGAWIGIRIAGLLLLLSGWKSTAVSRLFGVSRQAVVDWVRKANRQGLDSIFDVERSGRPTRLDRVAQDKLEKALAKSPEEFGLQRNRWDGVMLVEFLRQECNVELKPRQARNWLRRLGFVLRRPVYRYIQASNKGVARFRRRLKKNSTES
jgi:transposase